VRAVARGVIGRGRLPAADGWCKMAKENREMVWLQCTSCSDLNYRTQIKVAGGVQKVELKKYCPRERSHKLHKIKRK
jgi:large subunit ribosomal protein L33